MPCGTGKTFTALKLCEQAARLRPDKSQPFRVLYLMPSISLLQQNMREWAEQKDPGITHRYIGICSDRSAGKGPVDTIGDLTELEGEVTTNPEKIATRLTMQHSGADMLVVFSTYQSCELVGQAQRPAQDEAGKKNGGTAPPFDLIICDEAHRTTGVELDPTATNRSGFLLPHDNHEIASAKRLYMTATDRIYLEGPKSKAKEIGASIYSMDDTSVFGEVLYDMSFAEAIDKKLLSDYKILVITIDPTYKQFLHERGMLEVTGTDKDGMAKMDMDGRAKAIGTVKALTGGDDNEWSTIPTSIAFSNRIVDSKIFEHALPAAARRVKTLNPDIEIDLRVQHIDGKTKASDRRRRIEWLGEPRDVDGGELDGDETDEFRMLTNARCLSEGVDVPSLDGALFLAPKHSPIDIVQQVGRVMRKAKHKTVGYVVVPVLLADGATPEERIRNSGDYKTILKVVRALKSHDDELGRLLNVHELGGKIEVRNVASTRIYEDQELTEDEKEGIQQSLGFSTEDMINAIKVCLYDEVSDKEYWKTWARDIGQETQKLQRAVVRHLKQKDNKPLYEKFLDNCKETISPEMTDQQAVGMLAQHLVTKPVFDALYDNYDFAESNPISQVMDPVCDEIVEAGLLDELHKKAGPFYDSVALQAQAATKEGVEARHELVKQLYETYIKTAMPDMAEQLGVVYTPVEIVDWLLRSADDVLRQEFGLKLEDEGVEILDPFSGTGTFLTRLIQMEHTREDEPERTHLIATDKLAHKYNHELSAIEIMPTAYYISDINIEEAFHARMLAEDPEHQYVPYDGIALGNTLRMPTETAKGQTFRAQLFETDEMRDQNTPQLNKIAQKDVRVIVGNPPWRARQKNVKDGNPNESHPEIDRLITNSYSFKSRTANKNSLYDLYLKSLRWASNRIGDEGIIAFVTNGGWLEGMAASGVRACLSEEFTSIFIYNLKGRIPGAPDEGGNVFEVKVPVTMVVLVKHLNNEGECQILYTESNPGAKAREKLSDLITVSSLSSTKLTKIIPDNNYDWINQGDLGYQKYLDIGNKATKERKESSSIFELFSHGINTARDTVAYNCDPVQLRQISQLVIDSLNIGDGHSTASTTNLARRIINYLDNNIKSTMSRRSLDNTIPIRKTMFRPFFPQYVHYEKTLNWSHYQLDKIFPEKNSSNLTINVSGKGGKIFSSIMTGQVLESERERGCCPNLNLLAGATQTFPRFTYRPTESSNLRNGQSESQRTLGIDGTKETRLADSQKQSDFPDIQVSQGNQRRQARDIFDPVLESPTDSAPEGYVVEDNILDEALKKFQDHYNDSKITKDDIFFYCYGILHHPGFKTKYRNDLVKALPKIPFAPDFWAFAEAGRQLGELHVCYEQLKGYDLSYQTTIDFDPDNDDHWKFREKKQQLSKPEEGKDTITLKVNEKWTITGIPAKALEYQVNGKSALGWLADRYRIHTDKKHNTGIVNDANALFEDPRDYFQLVKQITDMSLKSLEVINSLPVQFETLLT